MSRQQTTGFTLIELVIAVAIVGLIAAIAIPSYQTYIQKSRRADAKIALTHAAAQQERIYMRQNSYTANIDDLGGTGGTLESPDGYYTVVVANNGCPNAQPAGSCFTLTATATSKGKQDEDTRCASFVLQDTGRKLAFEQGSGDDTTAECW